MIRNDSKEFYCPIGLYFDASETLTYQRYSFQPLIMFPLLLNNATRNTKASSRVLVLIPDMEASSSAVKVSSKQGGSFNQGTAIRSFHRVLDVALQSLKEAQKYGGFRSFLRLGNDVRQRILKVPVAFILADAKSQDQICSRYGAHNTNRMCRACHANFKDCEDYNHVCQ